MCLGAQARAANETARKNYEYQLKNREANWMQTLSITQTERVMHDQTIDASNIGLSQIYGDIQEKFGDQIGQALQEDEVNWKKVLEQSKGADLAAAGRTGRSIDRISTLDLAEYLKKGSRKAYELTESRQELSKAGRKAAAMTRAEQMNSFAKNAIIKNPDIAPPTPVYQNVGAAAFMDALKIAGTVASVYTGGVAAGAWGTAAGGGGLASSTVLGANAVKATNIATGVYARSSDRRLKENIQKIGESISGLGIYKFNYIGKAKQYIGAMADEVMKIVPKAVVTMDNDYLGVNYNLIDVTFKEV